MTALADRLRQLREERGWSQRDLARRADVTSGYISKIEQGMHLRPSGAKLAQVAAALGVPLAALLAPAPPPVEPTTVEAILHDMSRRLLAAVPLLVPVVGPAGAPVPDGPVVGYAGYWPAPSTRGHRYAAVALGALTPGLGADQHAVYDLDLAGSAADGDYVVGRVGGKLVLRLRCGGGWCEPRPGEPTMAPTPAEQLDVLGVVVSLQAVRPRHPTAGV